MVSDIEAYKPLAESREKYDTAKEIFMEAIEKDHPKELVMKNLISKIGLSPEQASALYDSEIGLISFRSGAKNGKTIPTEK